MSATRPRPPISGSSSGGVEKFKQPHVSDEGRQRLSELAKQRHQQGGFQKSGDGLKPAKPKPAKPRKTKKRRVAARVAEVAREKKTAQSIIDVFRDCVHPSQPANIRLKAATEWIKVEQEDAKLQLKEADSENQQRDREELLGLLSTRLTTGPAAILLRRQIESQAGITDGEVIDGHAHDA